jgi:microcystin-dependent protein
MSKSIQLKDINNTKYYPHPYYPIGSIYLSVNNTNPTRWFGGTWELIAQGRTLVGVDTNDTDFNTVKKTGGEKTHILIRDELPAHSHKVNVTYSKDSSSTTGGSYGIQQRYSHTYGGNDVPERTSSTDWNGISMSGGGNQPHNNLQPYFTCYIWCRTA